MRRPLILAVALALAGAACSSSEPTGPPVAAVAEVAIPGAPSAVTHGDDPRQPTPPGLVAQVRPEVAWPCEGDGTTGRRVQMLYVHGSGARSLNQLRSGFESYVRQIEGVFAFSSGQGRLLRMVTDASCALDIRDVNVSPNALASFDSMVAELVAQGFSAPNRIYHSWVDASAYCGLGTIYYDDQAGPANANETHSQYSRSDAGCWGYAEAHELVHNLGGVQNSAPHSTGASHCNDEWDKMCYSDGGPRGTMTYPCSDGALDDRLDCGGDDYFSTAPPAGSYLATHLNTADSSALSRGPIVTTIPPSTTSTTVPPTTSTTTGTGKTSTALTAPASVDSGVPFSLSAQVTGACTPTGTVSFLVGGVLLSRQVLASGRATVNLTLTGGVSRPTIRADYGGSASCAPSTASVRVRVR